MYIHKSSHTYLPTGIHAYIHAYAHTHRHCMSWYTYAAYLQYMHIMITLPCITMHSSEVRYITVFRCIIACNYTIQLNIAVHFALHCNKQNCIHETLGFKGAFASCKLPSWLRSTASNLELAAVGFRVDLWFRVLRTRWNHDLGFRVRTIFGIRWNKGLGLGAPMAYLSSQHHAVMGHATKAGKHP